MTDQAAANTDRELWRERPGDFYADSLHVTEGGGIGMNVGGYVIVKPLKGWHALAETDADLKETLKAVLFHFGPEGANKVASHAVMERKARRSNAEIDELEKMFGPIESPLKTA